MNPADDRLLELLETEGGAPPHLIEDHEKIDYSRTHINQRLIKLRDAGLVRMIGNGVYEITTEGQKYLYGKLDLRGVPEPDPNQSDVGTQNSP